MAGFPVPQPNQSLEPWLAEEKVHDIERSVREGQDEERAEAGRKHRRRRWYRFLRRG